MYIYVLKLENNKYFINNSKKPHYDIKKLFSFYNDSPKWIKKYKPNKLICIYKFNESTDDVNILTLKYMKKYGIENVRGGCFSSLNLSNYDLYTINLLNYNINKDSQCTRCNRFGHNYTDCIELFYPNSNYIFNPPKENYIECISSDISDDILNETNNLIKKKIKKKKKIKNNCCIIL